MNTQRPRLIFCNLLLTLLTIGIGLQSTAVTAQIYGNNTPVIAAGLGKGVNFGNMLEAPFEGAWGLTVDEVFFDKVAELGLEHIRLPVSWTHHADENAPYTIDESFFQRIDWCVDQALQRDIKIIVNNHHYDELNADPVSETPRALAIWEQIAQRYSARDDRVYFEILNEPHGEFNNNPALWDAFLAQALATVRQTNPTRKVLVGPVQWNSIEGLASFNPPADPNLIATIHYYSPFEFTHQGATWVDPPLPTGVDWFQNYKEPGDEWSNWSWNTTLTSARGSMKVKYDAGYAGFYLHNDEGVSNATHLVFSTDVSARLLVSITGPGSQGGTVVIDSTPGNNTYVIDLDDVGNPDPVTDVYIQNDSPDPLPEWRSDKLFFRLGGRELAHHLHRQQFNNIRQAFETAAEWSNGHNIPLHLGEFGSFSEAPHDSRLRWTTTVRLIANGMDLDWSYWELAAGFGFYDPDTGQFRPELTRSLIPGFGG